MSDRSDRAEEVEKDILKSVEDENTRIREAAEKAREDSGHDEGETEEEYNYRIANVPGIFGDTDTTAGAGATGMDVVSANNEQATAVAAAVEASDDDDTEGVSHDNARRQSDIAADGAPSAEEVDAAAPDDDKDDSDKKDADKPKTTRRGRKS